MCLLWNRLSGTAFVWMVLQVVLATCCRCVVLANTLCVVIVSGEQLLYLCHLFSMVLLHVFAPSFSSCAFATCLAQCCFLYLRHCKSFFARRSRPGIECAGKEKQLACQANSIPIPLSSFQRSRQMFSTVFEPVCLEVERHLFS